MTDLAAEVRAAVATTRAAGTARYEHVRFVDFQQLGPEWDEIPGGVRTPRDGSLRGDVERAATGALEAGLRKAGRWLVRTSKDPEFTTTRGVLDFDARRSLAVKGEEATLVEPGGIRERSAHDAWDPPDRPPHGADDSILWLVDVLVGATAAVPAGRDEDVRGASCRVLDVRCDLALAAHDTPGDVPAPAADDLDDLSVLPLRVWIGETYVHRVRRVDLEITTDTLDLHDHGAEIDRAVWERPPPRT